MLTSFVHRTCIAFAVVLFVAARAQDTCAACAQEDSVFLQAQKRGASQEGTEGTQKPKMQGKHQVLMPKPLSHSHGDAVMRVTPSWLRMLPELVPAGEPRRIVEAQLLSRLPPESFESESEPQEDPEFSVNFSHNLDGWRGWGTWQPMRERKESYGLIVKPDGISLSVEGPWGFANAMSTLYQLMDIKVRREEVVITIPGCPHVIEEDEPAFAHRGFLLDVARQWYSVPWIKGLITALSEFKLNVLHLHLTDTASWPLEIDGYPEVVQTLAFRDNNGVPLSYSRADIRELVEFARLRGVSIMPEIDGPTHAPALASGDPLHLTVAATVEYSTEQFAVEPPAGTWNLSDTHTMQFVRKALQQDFSTMPYLHLGGDEPVAASLCALLPEVEKLKCWEQCPSPWSPGCSPVPVKPQDARETYWFPEVLNEKVQGYFDSVDPSPAKVPRAVWSGAVADCGVQLPPTHLKSKSALQLWEFPADSSGRPMLSEDDCQKYDLLQSAATYPEGDSSYGWLYMDCGSGANWISMGPDYWCPRASWAALYSLNITQGYGPIETPTCQKAFLGGEMALWSEIGGMGNAMSLIFPRAAAFAERMWSNPQALKTEEMKGGRPPGWYWEAHLRDAMERLNIVVSNFDMLQLAVSHLQPEFCRLHPEFCNAYTESLY